MGVINAENTLQFKSSEQLFARIKKRLSSFDSLGLIDDGDFYEYVTDVLRELGLAVLKECEAVVHVKDSQARLPNNFFMFHAAFKCTPDFSMTKSINEQKPLIYYTDTEVSQECPNKCCIECTGREIGKTKIVIRTFINGDEWIGRYTNPIQLKLSPNVKALCTEDCLSLFSSNLDEITIDDQKIIRTRFDCGSIYLQYYGLPFDENELPMIPDQIEIEKAIEYYIYSQVFEDMMWNSTVANVVTLLQDARNQFNFHMGQARYWSRLPSFNRMIESVRRARSRKKFFYSPWDRTIAK